MDHLASVTERRGADRGFITPPGAPGDAIIPCRAKGGGNGPGHPKLNKLNPYVALRDKLRPKDKQHI